MPNVVCYKSCCTSPHRNGRLWTPLDQAADKGYADIIALLLEADAPLEAKDKSSVSVLIVRRKHARTYVHMLQQCSNSSGYFTYEVFGQ